MGVLLSIAATTLQVDPLSIQPLDDTAEIIVTGERAKRSLQDTPSSVAVIGEQQIESQAANRVDQLLLAIPNVQLGNGSEAPAIRGEDTTGVLQALDAFLGGARPRATMEIDGRAAGFQEYAFGTTGVWDVRQVEVFRSPLTVTHGRNSIAGGIVITTNDPSYEWEGRVRGIAGNFSTGQLSGLVSGPIARDQLAFRVAGDIRHQRTTSKLLDEHRGADPNDDDYSLLRFKLLAEPKVMQRFRLVGTFTHSYSRMPQIIDTKKPFKERKDPAFNAGIFGVRVNAATLRATQDFESGAIEAILSFGNTHIRRFAPISLGEAKMRLKDLSGDVFGNWSVTDGLTLQGGIHAVGSNLHQYIDLRNFIGSEGRFHDAQDSFGMFGEAELAVTSRLKLSGGGRYQQDKQRRVGGLTGAVPAPVNFDLHYSTWLPKLSLTYAVTPRINAGLLVERAYNPGGATIALNTGETDMFDAEYMWDYEAFLKGGVRSLNLTIAANLFYNDKRDAQRIVLVPFTLPGGDHDFFMRFNNVPKAHAYGSEIELGWQAAKNLRLSGAFGTLWTGVDRTDADDEIGKEFERGPHWSGSASAEWTPADRLELFAQVRFRDGYFSDNFKTSELRVPGATSVDARASYAIGRFTVFAYAQNIFDSLNILYRYDPDFAELEEPRIVGIGLEAGF